MLGDISEEKHSSPDDGRIWWHQATPPLTPTHAHTYTHTFFLHCPSKGMQTTAMFTFLCCWILDFIFYMGELSSRCYMQLCITDAKVSETRKFTAKKLRWVGRKTSRSCWLVGCSFRSSNYLCRAPKVLPITFLSHLSPTELKECVLFLPFSLQPSCEVDKAWRVTE